MTGLENHPHWNAVVATAIRELSKLTVTNAEAISLCRTIINALEPRDSTPAILAEAQALCNAAPALLAACEWAAVAMHESILRGAIATGNWNRDQCEAMACENALVKKLRAAIAKAKCGGA